ncbi:retrovirus-related pol polyprotein from transposon TNT 1-94 [Tanacetum coccineum]
MTLYNALPCKEYERVFMCKTAKEQTIDDSNSQRGSDEDVDEEEAKAFNLMARNFRKVSGVKATIAQEKGKVATIAKKKVTSLVSVRSPKRTRLLSEELGAIAKNATNHKTKQHVSWKSTLKRNRRLFTSYKAYDGGNVVFGSNLKGKVTSGGNISHDSITITNVDHVSGLAFNLISVDNSIQQICLASMVDNSTLSHMRLGHTNMQLFQNLPSNELVRNLPKLSFERHFYDTCGPRSQGNANNRTRIEVSTSRVLEMLHLDLFGPSLIQSYRCKFYTLMLVDDHSDYN